MARVIFLFKKYKKYKKERKRNFSSYFFFSCMWIFFDVYVDVFSFFFFLKGIPNGHTGHVRFLTCVETGTPSKPEPRPKVNRYSLKSKKVHQNNINRGKLLVISGGDGYEDFRGPQASAELQTEREDSTNHLLLWKM